MSLVSVPRFRFFFFSLSSGFIFLTSSFFIFLLVLHFLLYSFLFLGQCESCKPPVLILFFSFLLLNLFSFRNFNSLFF